MLDSLALDQCGAFIAFFDERHRQRNMDDDNGTLGIDQICRQMRRFPTRIPEVGGNHDQSRKRHCILSHTEHRHRGLRHDTSRRVFTNRLRKLSVMVYSHHKQLGAFLFSYVTDRCRRIADHNFNRPWWRTTECLTNDVTYNVFLPLTELATESCLGVQERGVGSVASRHWRH